MAKAHKIESAVVSLYRVPLDEVLIDSAHGVHSHFDLAIVKLTTDDGIEGYGYTYTGGVGGSTIATMLNKELIPIVIGQDADCIEKLWNDMMWRVHYVGRGGIASFAISAVDIALYDIRAKRAGLPLVKLLGGSNDRVKCYGGGIDLNFDLPKLMANTQKYLDQGMKAVKIKVGRPNLEEDLERIAEVRKQIGPNIDFMADCNMKWSVDKVMRARKTLLDNNLYWLEEPLIPEDYEGLRKIANLGIVAVAGGENYRTYYEFHNVLKFGHLDFVQVDVGNIGGITGFLRVAHLTQANNLPLCSHGMQELHVSLLSAFPNSDYLEIHSFPIDRYTEHPLKIENGFAIAPSVSGTGVSFKFDLLEPYKVNL